VTVDPDGSSIRRGESFARQSPKEEDVMPLTRLKSFLDERSIKYRTIHHSRAYSSQQIAQAAHVSGYRLAKVTMVKVDGRMAMAVLAAPALVDPKALAELAGAKKVELATEGEFKDLFPGCETGAMPPFGNLYEMPVYLDESLFDAGDISFEAGSHTELLQLDFDDYRRLVEPKTGSFAVY
jgi:Ala-tRNA(Pro) deacylase